MLNFTELHQILKLSEGPGDEKISLSRHLWIFDMLLLATERTAPNYEIDRLLETPIMATPITCTYR